MGSSLNIVVLTAFVWLSVSLYEFPSVTGPPNERKMKFPTFETFFPFYLTEHSDRICRILHVVGTFITLAVTIRRDFRLLVSLFASIGVGLIVRQLTIGMVHGAVEAASMALFFLIVNRVLLKTPILASLSLLAIGYAFAWVGHFVFEGNRPATFIYPVFSLISDFKLFFGVTTGAIKI